MSRQRNDRQIISHKEDYGDSKKRLAIAIIFLGMSFLIVFHAWGQTQKTPVITRPHISFRVMEWNLENLFDIQHDTLKNDYEFLPDAIRHWNYNRYQKKLVDIARVITAVGEWTPPALVGLCEIENDSVLRDLTRRSPLKKLGYRYVVTHSPDQRGIDVALLYQRDVFKLISYQSITIPPFRQHRPTRDLLHVSGLLLTGDTLDVIVCHFPSRSGGAKESEPYRLHTAQILQTAADSILFTRQHPQLIIMGDFNDYPTNKSIREVLSAQEPPINSVDTVTSNSSSAFSMPSISPQKLYHLLARKAKSRDFGSYKYHGEWGLLDHLIVSGTLLNKESNFYTSEEKAQVFRAPFLLTKDKKYGDDEPFRTYKGMKYQGGISDHLPIYSDFELIFDPETDY
ncbi:endonuclease/exonuclease/phosphatase family protein [Bacteroides sp.]|uniref:endonuclease/exonuclease/phosphatase family protein n=1 Tax=Bacteroides sp. TaxID=29523 RepID=UPI002632D91A|nr:endonuclease/exonuclease/phosphatase family protein [Bacteroides sp.]MDD3038205.1 endonuclease [Bacteroides sp.]